MPAPVRKRWRRQATSQESSRERGVPSVAPWGATLAISQIVLPLGWEKGRGGGDIGKSDTVSLSPPRALHWVAATRWSAAKTSFITWNTTVLSMKWPFHP